MTYGYCPVLFPSFPPKRYQDVRSMRWKISVRLFPTCICRITAPRWLRLSISAVSVHEAADSRSDFMSIMCRIWIRVPLILNWTIYSAWRCCVVRRVLCMAVMRWEGLWIFIHCHPSIIRERSFPCRQVTMEPPRSKLPIIENWASM